MCARTVLATNEVGFRSRPHSDEEEAFLAHSVAGTGMGVTYADVENASVVLLLGFEPEDEAATIWLRLRKANRRKNLAVRSEERRVGKECRSRWGEGE